MSKLVSLAEKEIMRKNILEVLEECEQEGASEELIAKCLVRIGHSCTVEEVKRECTYLKGKGLVEINHVENKTLGISRNVVKVTSNGMDVLDGTSVVEGVGG
ncbi:MAG: hypothetical protein UF228_06710 [Lachnospiraceae bacterium]|nr:hypothetical protein [Lachnospiraceae bacterium]